MQFKTNALTAYSRTRKVHIDVIKPRAYSQLIGNEAAEAKSELTAYSLLTIRLKSYLCYTIQRALKELYTDTSLCKQSVRRAANELRHKANLEDSEAYRILQTELMQNQFGMLKGNTFEERADYADDLVQENDDNFDRFADKVLVHYEKLVYTIANQLLRHGVPARVQTLLARLYTATCVAELLLKLRNDYYDQRIRKLFGSYYKEYKSNGFDRLKFLTERLTAAVSSAACVKDDTELDETEQEQFNLAIIVLGRKINEALNLETIQNMKERTE